MNRRRDVRFFAVVSLFTVSCNLAHPVTPSLFKLLALPDYMFGVALACMSLGNTLFSPFFGKLSGVRPSRNIMLVCCVGYAVGQVLFAFSRSTLMVMAVRTFSGVFIGGVFVAMLNYVVNTSPDEKERGQRLVWLATLQGVSAPVGYLIGGFLGELGVLVAVFAQAGTLLLCAALFRIVCARDVADTRDAAVGGNAPVGGRGLLREANPFSAFARGWPYMASAVGPLFVVCALQYFSLILFDQTFNYYAIDQLGLSTGSNGAIKGVMGLMTLLVNATLCAYLLRRGDLRRPVVAVLAAGAAAIGASLFTRSLAPFLVINILFYALLTASAPLLQNLVAEASRERSWDSNLVMGFYNAMRNLGGIAGALLAGFTYILFPRAPFVCCLAGMLAAVVIAACYAARRPRARSTPPAAPASDPPRG